METTLIAHSEDGHGIPLVWIHGFPLSSKVFDPQIGIPGFRHIRPDLRGFGMSPPPEGEMTVARYARDVLDLLDALGIERAAMAGLSMGGYVLMQILRDAPERVSAILLCSTREVPDGPDARANRLRQAAEVEAGGTKGVVEAMLPKMIVSESFRDGVRHIMESASPAGVVAALKAMAARPDSADTLRSVRVPALITAGEQDAIIPVADAERMQSLIAGSELAVIPNAAHLANFERPQEFNARVQEFLRR